MFIRKSLLYRRLFLTYAVVVICLLGSFDFYLITYARMESKNSRIYLGERLSSDINELLVEFENSNRFIVNTIYCFNHLFRMHLYIKNVTI